MSVKRVTTQEEADDRVDEWHKGDSELPLHEYMGWTWEEYKHWVEKCEIPS